MGDSNTNDYELLQKFAKEGDHVRLHELLKRGNLPRRKATPLHGSCRNGHLEAAAALIAHGADIHAKAKRGMTSLYFACKSGHLHVVKLLLQQGAVINPCMRHVGNVMWRLPKYSSRMDKLYCILDAKVTM